MKAGKGIASFWQEFKAFAFKGNMIDLAVAVVIGTAFSAVINSLVKDIIMPSISYVTAAAADAGSKAADVAKSTASAVGVTSKPAQTQPAATQPATTPATATPATENAVAAAATATGASSIDPKVVQELAAAIKAATPPPPPPPAPEAKPVDISWTIGRIKIGNFIGELINFVLVALAVFVVIVKLLGSVMKRVQTSTPAEGPTTKECPFCLSVIPIKATKCGHCTADLPGAKLA